MLEINVNNIDDLKKNLNKINFKNSLKKASGRSLIYLEWEAKKETPIDTWVLRNSYEIDNNTFWYWKLNNFREYAEYVHSRNPYMLRAGDKAKPRIIKIFEQEVAHTIKTSNIWLRV